MFLSVLNLAASTNAEGYPLALANAWEQSGLTFNLAPSKSSLSEARAKISYEFFEDIYRDDLKLQHNRQSYKGLYVYAVDGDQFELPASHDVLSYNFRGYPSSKGRETHYPKMYTAQVLDIMSGGIVRDFAFSTEQDEMHLACMLAGSFENNSVSIYDRLHCSFETMRAHEEAGNYFIMRARIEGHNTYRELASFVKANTREKAINWRSLNERRVKADIEVRAIKFFNPKTKKDYVFVTNLPSSFTRREIANLYLRRWDIETSFKEMTCVLKLGKQWHSTKINGILQEIFALLWLVNSTRRQMAAVVRKRTATRQPLDRAYRKTNFKLSVAFILKNIHFLISRETEIFYQRITIWMERLIQKRIRLSRSYPRVVKHRGREYKQANLVPRRKCLTEQH